MYFMPKMEDGGDFAERFRSRIVRNRKGCFKSVCIFQESIKSNGCFGTIYGVIVAKLGLALGGLSGLIVGGILWLILNSVGVSDEFLSEWWAFVIVPCVLIGIVVGLVFAWRIVRP